MKKTIHIIGSGFSSLSASCYLAKAGYDVVVLEKNETVGGRARQLIKDGFTFDIGPTWYWMPDVFEKFFADFGKKPSDYYELEKLDPAYQVYFDTTDSITIPGSVEEIYEIFETEEKGSSVHLKTFLKSAAYNYDVSINDLVYNPGVSPLELVTPVTIGKITQFFSSIRKEVRRKIKSKKLIQILEFPVLFLGAKPSNTPAFYNFMNYADFVLGTWHPKGGMYKVIEAMVTLSKDLGVTFKTEANVEEIKLNQSGEAIGLVVNGHFVASDIVLSGADYHHTETLLPKDYRQYSEKYWDKKVFAPSSLLFYVGFDKKLKDVCHHTLFFDTDFDVHAASIYDNPSWPKDPMFYASFPSITEGSFAPINNEAATFLIPIAPGIEDTPELREKYFDLIINRLEKLTQQSVKENVIFKESFCVKDFVKDYNSYKGNAYGLANILTQTAFLRPKIKSKKVKNLFFTGQLTVPGPGVPPSLISGKIASDLILKHH
ncbi:phytoene desaturase family protein [Tenacibaculum finnmarkense]|uniref:Phytoene desaturase n=1 Tax=Tenacibaculum finnmarkense genomovar finnmarkense TaxID=1458503 RepID=A0AAP1WGL4_9FLAO|nr:phytoene desaturase family protein [Tenacibaculum finnmarkense]MBE7653147.1 phytoene desaturase [Tenacibaculum finnmarkense genomovar finnmarkense]MBE7695483.1 phytoene desaturase [Tenacibaculum finnmarkense genomovar finnmarkense]MCD8427615.1 phytoene desaturase [Tenacibaculum finnmarkense genomovar finnmarkense]MCG8248340.1 phytoene desaturase [Tenacibaculum finnmarkense genomovar finnmarkense]MCG8731351.1 phytoene desaturase [Tenacibaculum finnmarkense]